MRIPKICCTFAPELSSTPMHPHQLPTLSDLRAAQTHFSGKTSTPETPALYKDECFAILGAAMEVQNTLGQGFSELVYHAALRRELQLRDIPFESEKEITVLYKGCPLDCTYRADMVCYGEIIIELKMVNSLLPEHTAQLLNYLKATGKKLGVLINFGQKPLGYKYVPNHIMDK